MVHRCFVDKVVEIDRFSCKRKREKMIIKPFSRKRLDLNAGLLPSFFCCCCPALPFTTIMTQTLPMNPRFCCDFVSAGCLRGKACRLRHDIKKCGCGLVLPASDYASHSLGKRHRDALAGKGLRPRRQSSTRASPSQTTNGYCYDEDEIDARPADGHFAGAARVPRCPKCSRFIATHLLQEHLDTVRLESSFSSGS
jgi:hypothetical protein